MHQMKIQSKYAKGQIYCVVSPNTKKMYIGRTIQTLKKCFSGHINQKIEKKHCTSIQVVNAGCSSIRLICNYPCQTENQLKFEQTRWINHFRNVGLEIVNELEPGASAAVGGIKRYKQIYDKKYNQINREIIKQKKKEYTKINKEKVKAKNILKKLQSKLPQ